MPRSGAITLSDVPKSTLAFVCDKCGREGLYSVARLFAKHADIGLPDLTAAISKDRPRRTSADFYDRCAARIVTGT
jgi:hypothetical protein